jgi:hypothetical protein
MSKSYRQEVVECLAATLKWSLEDASNVVGDTTEYEDEEMSVTEATGTIIDAMKVST